MSAYSGSPALFYLGAGNTEVGGGKIEEEEEVEERDKSLIGEGDKWRWTILKKKTINK